jgi:hypothetical protein
MMNDPCTGIPDRPGVKWGIQRKALVFSTFSGKMDMMAGRYQPESFDKVVIDMVTQKLF